VIEREQRGDVRVLRMAAGQNLFSDAFLDAVHGALDEVEGDDAAAGVVLTGSDKFFSNGFDLEYLGSLDGTALRDFVLRAQALLARILVFPMPTAAAVNGHAFGIGALLALSHDQRVMRADRGWFCLPEIDLGLPFQPFMTALIQARLSDLAASEAVLTGRRYTGTEAVAAGIAQMSADGADLLGVAVDAAAARAGKGRQITRQLKRDLYVSVLTALDASDTERDDARGRAG
jgi:Delta3-Delta2-enoyl-CoA isomerase